MQVFSQGCFKFPLFIREDWYTMWQNVENFYATIECTFFKKKEKIQVGIWSMKMVLIPCVNIVYRRIYLKNFLIIDNEVH